MNTPTPECNKMLAVQEESQAIGEFLEWLVNQGIELAIWYDQTGDGDWDFRPCRKNATQLLADYFNINLKKVDAERRALLEELRTQ